MAKLGVSARVAGFIDLLDNGESERFASEITSGEVWGHMGSFFDSVLDDPALQRRYDEALRKLAESLQEAGVTSSHLEFQAAFLRGELPAGWQRTKDTYLPISGAP